MEALHCRYFHLYTFMFWVCAYFLSSVLLNPVYTTFLFLENLPYLFLNLFLSSIVSKVTFSSLTLGRLHLFTKSVPKVVKHFFVHFLMFFKIHFTSFFVDSITKNSWIFLKILCGYTIFTFLLCTLFNTNILNFLSH